MRRSSPPFQFIAAATTDATMSSRAPYRGRRNQRHRNFSDRPSGGRGDYVTGDSHFMSVRDSNLRLRQGGEREDFANNTGFQHRQFNPRPPPNYQNQPFNPRPHLNQNQTFNSRPHFNPNQSFNPRPYFQHNQPFRQPPPFRPRPLKPPDYRSWEYARPGPPPHCERFIVLSYNLLADYLAINHRSRLYRHIPHHILDWEWRKRSIIFELGLWSADIMCFQEVDRFQDLEEELKLRGYSGIWKMRTGVPVDGCAIFWRTSRFKLLREECIEFNKLGLRDNVAQICVFESVRQNFTENTSALSASSTGSNKVVICNIHVLFNPGRGEIKLGQVRLLLDRAHAVSKLWNDAPIVICGDFNCTPKSPLYNFISEQKLDLSGLARNKVSGQASGEIKLYSPNSGIQSADNSVRPPTIIDEREVGIKQSVFLSNMQKQNNPDSNVENVLSVNNLSQPQYSETVLDVSDKSCTDEQYEKENSAVSDEVRKKTQQEAVDGYEDETGSANPIPVDGLKENPSSFHSEGGFPVDPTKDGIYEFTPPIASNHKDIHSDAIEMEGGEKVNVISHSDYRSLSEHSRTNICPGDESVNGDRDTLSFVGEDYSVRARVESEPVNTFKSDISSSELLRRTSLLDLVEVSSPGSSGNLSSQSVVNKKGSPLHPFQANVSFVSSNIDFVVDEKMENLSLNELDEAKKGGGNLGEDGDGNFGEDYNTFLSQLHNTEYDFPSLDQFVRSDVMESDHFKECAPSTDEVFEDFPPGLDTEAVDVEKITYDPSSWTPMEVETATGNADCTLLEQPVKLRSTYAEVEDFSGTRDSNGEPLVTSYHRCFLGTVDYIWRTEGLQTVRVLAPLPKHAMQWTPGFPTKKWGSDHIALASELAFIKDLTDHNKELQ